MGEFKLTSNWTQLSNGYDTAGLDHSVFDIGFVKQIGLFLHFVFLWSLFCARTKSSRNFFFFFFLPDLFVSFDAETTLDPLLVAESDWDLGTNFQVLSFLVLLRG